MTTDTLSRVVALVRDVYGAKQPIAADTKLADLDGDSLGRMLLAVELEKAFGASVPPLDEERWTTIADIVAWAERAQEGRGE